MIALSFLYSAVLVGLGILARGVFTLHKLSTNHLHHLQLGLDDLRTEAREHTDRVVYTMNVGTEEIKGLRTDIQALAGLGVRAARRKK